MHEMTVRPRPSGRTSGEVARRLEAKYRGLEIADLFAAAGEMGLDPLTGHVLAEANLDYVTDGPFDATSADNDGDEAI